MGDFLRCVPGMGATHPFGSSVFQSICSLFDGPGGEASLVGFFPLSCWTPCVTVSPPSPKPVLGGASGKGSVGAPVALGHAKERGRWPVGSGDSCLGHHLLGVWSTPGQQWPGAGGAHDCWERLFFKTVKWVLGSLALFF